MLSRFLLSLLCLASVLPGCALLPGGAVPAAAQQPVGSSASSGAFIPRPIAPRPIAPRPIAPALAPVPVSASAAFSAQLAAANTSLAAANAGLAAANASISAANAKILALAPTPWPGPYANPRTDGSGLVFVHSVLHPFNGVTIQDGGAVGATAGWRQTIQELKARGVDGIAADIQTISPVEKDNLTTLFEADDQENAACTVGGVIQNNGHGVSKFYILLTPDMSTLQPETPPVMAQIAGLVIPFLQDPACATYQGHPVLSLYEGDGGGASAVASVYNPFLAQVNAALTAAGKPTVYFLPGWGGAGGSTAGQEIAAVSGSIGAWNFGDPTTPLGLNSPLPAQEALAASVQSTVLPSGNHALWMQAIYPLGYWKPLGNNPSGGKIYNEYHGVQAYAANMASAINTQKSFWLEPLTLDDETEGDGEGEDAASEYLPNHWDEIYPTNTPDFYQKNAGLHVAEDYYNEWFKTQKQPVITSDTLIVSNLTQLAAAAYAPTNDPTGPLTIVSGAAGDPPGVLTDHVDVMTLLTQSGQVEVSGVTPAPTFLPVSAGINQLVFPVTQAGTPLVQFLKNNQVRRQVTGHAIAAAATLVNLNPASFASQPGLSFGLTGSTTFPVDSAGIMVRGTAGSFPLAVGSLVWKDLSGTSPVIITQNDLNGPAGQPVSVYTPAGGTALTVGKNNAPFYLSFITDPTGTGLPNVVTAGIPNLDNLYYTTSKQTASTHWSVSLPVKRITNDPTGEAGVALVCSNGGPAGNDYFDSAVFATISVSGATTLLHLANVTPVVTDVRASDLTLPVNSLALGEWYMVTIEYNAGTVTATAVPSNQQL